MPALPVEFQTPSGYENCFITISKLVSEDLGLSIQGSDAPFQGFQVVRTVFAQGACAKDGRIKPEDVLKMVNGRSLFALSSKDAIQLLHQPTEKVTLMVTRKKQPIKDSESNAGSAAAASDTKRQKEAYLQKLDSKITERASNFDSNNYLVDSDEESDGQEHRIDPLDEMDSDFEEEDFNVEHKTMIDKVLKKYTRPKTISKETPQHENQGPETIQQMKNRLKPTSSKVRSSDAQERRNNPKDTPPKERDSIIMKNNSPKKWSDNMSKTEMKQTNDANSQKLRHADSSLLTDRSQESLYISSEEERLPRRRLRRDQRRKASSQRRKKWKEESTSREMSRSPMKDAEVQTNNTQEIGIQTFAEPATFSNPEMTIDLQSNRSETALPEPDIFDEVGPSEHELKRMEEKYFKNLQKLLNTVEEANNSIEKPKNVTYNDTNYNDTMPRPRESPKFARRRQTSVKNVQYKPISKNDYGDRPVFNSVPSPLLISPVKPDREMDSPFTVSSPLLINPIKETSHQIRLQPVRERPNMQYPVTEDSMCQVRRLRRSSPLFASRFADLESPLHNLSNIPKPPFVFRDENFVGQFEKYLEQPFNLPITPPLTSRCPTIWKDGDPSSGSIEALSPLELEARAENAHKLQRRVHKIDRQFGIMHTDDQGVQTSLDFDDSDIFDDDYGEQNQDKEVQTTLSGLYRSKTLLLDCSREAFLDPTKYIHKKEEPRKTVSSTELDMFKDKFRAKPKKEILVQADQDKKRNVKINQFPVKREDEYCRVKRRQIDKLEGAFDFMEQQQEAVPSSEPEKVDSESEVEEPQEEPIPEPKPQIPSPSPLVAPKLLVPVSSGDEGQQKPVKVLIKRFDSFEKKDKEKSLEDIRMTPPRKTKWDHPKKESRKVSPSPIKENQDKNPNPTPKTEMFPAPKSKFDTTDDELLGEKAEENSKNQAPPNVRARKEMFETRETQPMKPKDENNQTVIIRKESAGLKDFLKKNPRQAIRKSNERQPRPPAGFNSSSDLS